MTHNDVYTKFMIGYDKANVTSSYPALTKYEVATILDKAYDALIAQKVTGNNPRRVPFEADQKQIADLQKLITYKKVQFKQAIDGQYMETQNVSEFDLPEDFKYYVRLLLEYNTNDPTEDRVYETAVFSPNSITYVGQDDDKWVSLNEGYKATNPDEQREIQQQFGDWIQWRNLYYATGIEDIVNTNLMIAENSDGKPYDRRQVRMLPVKLVSHDIAEKFITTAYNMPWVKNPVCYIYDDTVAVVYDALRKPNVEPEDIAHFIYIRSPKKFVTSDPNTCDFSSATEMEISDTASEELINLAISFALENTESSARLSTKLNMRGLES